MKGMLYVLVIDPVALLEQMDIASMLRQQSVCLHEQLRRLLNG